MNTVRQIMTRGAVTCRADARLQDAARAMWEHDIGMLPVNDDSGRVIGAITDRDIAMATYIQGRPLAEIPVASAMSNRLFTVRATTPLTEVERTMADHQIRRLPVVDEDGRAIGMVSMTDLARHSSSSRDATIPAPDLAATLRAVCRPRTVQEVGS